MIDDGSNTIFLQAGCPEKDRLSDLWAFDVNVKMWRSLPAAPDPPRGGTSITYSAGKLYLMNGFDGQKDQGGNVDVFGLGSEVWSTIAYPVDGKKGPEARSVSALLPLEVDSKRHLITLFGEHDPSTL